MMPAKFSTDGSSQLSWQRIEPPAGWPAVEIWCCQLLCPLPLCAGNKWLKLKHHIKHIQQTEKAGIFTCGGAHSNHLAAVAAASAYFGFRSLALVRQQHQGLTPTLAFCQANGMQFRFIDAQQYRQRGEPAFLQQLISENPDWLWVPEGGSSALGVAGVRELNLHQTPAGPADLLVTACGSGGTAAGLSQGHPDLPVLAISVVKDPLLPQRLQHLGALNNVQLMEDVTGLRYGRFNDAILQLCLHISTQGLAFEPIYTGKALYTLLQLLQQKQLASNQRIVFFHTGGLQGLAGLLQKQQITFEQYQQLNQLASAGLVQPVVD
jgi:1-aminocyclopropane-1-carboxylate deaminase